MHTYEEMEHEFLKQKAYEDVMNVISIYCFEHNMTLQMRYFNKWSRREDIRHEMPWGNTTGHENLEYNNPWADKIRHPYDARTMGGGVLFVHFTTTPMIEIADDLQTARCVFLSPGIEASAAATRDAGCWAWSRYAFEMIYEEGEWRVWRERVYPVFRSDYYEDFAKVHEEDLTKTPMGDRFEDFAKFFAYTPDVIMPRNEPDPTEPYDTWAPGWNFGTN